MHGQPFELKTEKGLKFTFIGLLLFIAWQILMIILIISMRDALAEFFSESATDESETYEAIMPFIGPLCGIIFIFLILMIFLFLGVMNLYTGRAEFGEEHKKNTEKGIFLLIMGFIIGMINGLISGFGQSPTNFQVIISMITIIISSVCYGFGYIFILKSLIDPQGMTFLKTGFILMILINIINYGLVIAAQNMDIEFLELVENSLLIGVIFMSISIIPWAIYSFVFLRARLLVQWGVVKHVLPKYDDRFHKARSIQQQYPDVGMGMPDQVPHICPSCKTQFGPDHVKCPKCGYFFEDDYNL